MAKIQSIEVTNGQSITVKNTALHLPYNLLFISGFTLSRNGVSKSIVMIVDSSVIILLNIILTVKSATCFTKEDEIQMPRSTDKLYSLVYVLTMLISSIVMLKMSITKLPTFIKLLDKYNGIINNQKLQTEMFKSMRNRTIVGFFLAGIFTIGFSSFEISSTMNYWNNCPYHREMFSSREQYRYFAYFFTVSIIFVAPQGFAGLTYYNCVCGLMASYFNHLTEKMKQFVNISLVNTENNSNSVNDEELRHLRYCYEYVCELTSYADDMFNSYVGVLVCSLIPLVCLIVLNTFFPEFREDYFFYSVIILIFSGMILISAANLHSRVKFTLKVLHFQPKIRSKML